MVHGGTKITEPQDLAALYGVLGGESGDAWVSEDHLQDAIIRYWEQAAAGTAFTSAPAWVRTVARNLARSEGRRRTAERRALARLGEQVRTIPYDPDPVVDLVRRLVAALPPRQREIVVLRYYGDLSVAQVAAKAGCSPGTVKATLHQARRHWAPPSCLTWLGRQPERKP